VHDEDGPVRKFASRAEAKRWVAGRNELTLLKIPQDKPPSIFETSEEALF
jgi:hypothetical protein